MFSNLSQNSILYILDLKGDNKILTGPIEKVSPPRPRYNNFNPNMEMVVDITAIIKGEKREFKNVPNSNIVNFGEESFVLAESKETLSSYITAMLNNSKNIVDSVDKHKKLITDYECALEELNPEVKANAEKDKAIKTLQDQVSSLQDNINKILNLVAKKES